VDGLCRVRRRIRPKGLANQSHGMRRVDEAVFRPIGRALFRALHRKAGSGER
jgi:hypothetical protein